MLSETLRNDRKRGLGPATVRNRDISFPLHRGTQVLLLITLISLQAVSGGTANSSSSSVHMRGSSFWEQGLSEARKGNIDSAQACLQRSFKAGISDDSLYYLWAEIFIYKGVLDTALALNFSVPASAPSDLKKKTMEQRYLIYSSLGWWEKAKEMVDSVETMAFPGSGWRSLLLPECNFYVAAGGYKENNAVDRVYPRPRSSDSMETVTNGYATGLLRFGWKIPFLNRQGVRFGARLRYSGSRFSVTSSDLRLQDSTDAMIGGFIGYSLLSDRVSATYTCSRKRDFLDKSSVLHQFSVRYALYDDKWLASFEGGYHHEFPVREQYCYLMGYLERDMGKRNNIAASLFLSGMSAGEYSFKESEWAYISVQDGYVYDTSYSARLKTFQPYQYEKGIRSRIPQSYTSVNPQVNFERKLSGKLVVGAGTGYSCTWFINSATWLDYGYPEGAEPQVNGILIDGKRSCLAFNRNDGNYYWVDSIVPGGGYILARLDSIPLFRSSHRVDQSVILDLFLRYRAGRFGTFGINFMARRNYSTLMEQAPFDIERWYGSLVMTWIFRFKPGAHR